MKLKKVAGTYLAVSEYEVLKTISQKYGRSVSGHMRYIIRKELENERRSNNTG